MDKLAFFQVDTHMLNIPPCLEKDQVPGVELINIDPLTHVHLMFGGTGEFDAVETPIGLMDKSGTIHPIHAQSTVLVRGAFPFIVLGIKGM